MKDDRLKSNLGNFINLRKNIKFKLAFIIVILCALGFAMMAIDKNPVGASSGDYITQRPSEFNLVKLYPFFQEVFAPPNQAKPDIFIEKKAEPSVAKVGDRILFTIEIFNDGDYPAENTVVTDIFNPFLSVNSVSSTKGNYDIRQNQVVFDIGTIDPDQKVTIKITVTVNQGATNSQQIVNTAYIQYYDGNKTVSRQSNAVYLQISATSTLPPTGGMEIQSSESSAPVHRLINLAIGLGITGFYLLFTNRRIQKSQTTHVSWLGIIGVALILSGIVIGLPACGLDNSPKNSQMNDVNNIDEILVNTPVAFKAQSQQQNSQLMPTLGDTTVLELSPKPSEAATIELENQPVDMTPITRVVISRLGLDNAVVYTPFDGFTWQIAELGQDIGWMENTSIPGLGSNTGLSAHLTMNDGSDGPFKHLDDLKAGDVVEVFTEKKVYTYVVSSQEVVDASDFSIVESTENAQLTLITCADWHVGLAAYLSRYVVYADLVDIQAFSQAISSN